MKNDDAVDPPHHRPAKTVTEDQHTPFYGTVKEENYVIIG
jgi:hypothetical protein